MPINEWPPSVDDEKRKTFLNFPGIREQFLGAQREGNADTIVALKEEYESKFPEERETIETIFGAGSFLATQEEIEITKEWDEKVSPELYRRQTEYNFLLTHFAHANMGDREFMKQLWSLLTGVAEVKGGTAPGTLEGLRKGVLSQVALTKIFEELGETPQTATPEEDAYLATDLWVHGKPVQIKGKNTEDPIVMQADETAFPATVVGPSGKGKYFTTQFANDISKFRFKIKKYGERTGRKFDPYFVVMPYQKIDAITGEPSKELVEYFRKHNPAES